MPDDLVKVVGPQYVKLLAGIALDSAEQERVPLNMRDGGRGAYGRRSA